jgi:hypothetical protein
VVSGSGAGAGCSDDDSGSGDGLGVGVSLDDALSPGTVTGLPAEDATDGEKLVLGGSACWTGAAQAASSTTAAAAVSTPNRVRRVRRAW